MPRIIDGNKNNMVGEQKQLSEKLETLAIYICRGSVSRIEDGSRTVTDIELYGLSLVLGVSIEALFPSLKDNA